MPNETDTHVEPNVGTSAQDLDAWANQPVAEPEPPKPAKEAEPATPSPKKAAKPKPAPAPVTAATPEPPPAAPAFDPQHKIKVVVDGEEMEITLDQAIKGYRKNAAADKRFREAEAARKEAEALKPLEQFRGMFGAEDVEAAKASLRAEGITDATPQQLRARLAEQIILEIIEREKLQKENPAELLRREEESRRKTAEAEVERMRAEAKKAEEDAARQHYQRQFDQQFTSALQKADLPVTPYTIMRMADLMAAGMQRGIDVSADELTSLVREDLLAEQAKVIASLRADQAVKYLPKAFLDALRKYDVEQVKTGAVKPNPPPALPRAVPRDRKRTLSPAEANKDLEAWANGR